MQTLIPPDGPEHPGWGHKEFILDDDDCPLNILMHTPPSKGNGFFVFREIVNLIYGSTGGIWKI